MPGETGTAWAHFFKAMCEFNREGILDLLRCCEVSAREDHLDRGSSQEKVSTGQPVTTLYVQAQFQAFQGELLAQKPHPMLTHLSYQEQLAKSGTTDTKKQGYYMKGHSQNSGL